MTTKPIPAAPATASMPEAQRQQQALAALRAVLAPAARLMVTHGVQLPQVVETLKQVLVEAAIVGHRSQSKGRPNDTQLSLLTGVHRKDVKRLLQPQLQAQPTEADAVVSVGHQVVARWISDPRFLSADGSPLPLARTPRYAEDGAASFSELVGAVSSDVGARALLDSLLHLDVVREVSDSVVALRLRGFVPTKATRESLHFLAANVGDHLASAVHNQELTPATGVALPTMLEQSAFSDGLSASQAQQLHDAARAWWAKALQAFLRDATLAEQQVPPRGEARYRVRFGAYFFQAEQSPPKARTPSPTRSKDMNTKTTKKTKGAT